ncbi:NUMOD4 domain-containing protein [Furfurilactobacillus cerevisiae]
MACRTARKSGVIAMTEEWRPVVGFEGWYEVSRKSTVAYSGLL